MCVVIISDITGSRVILCGGLWFPADANSLGSEYASCAYIHSFT